MTTMLTDPTVRDMLPTLLDQHRPDRYDPTDKAWQAPVVEALAAEIPVVEARRLAAERIVSTTEATATKRTNRMMREIFETGQWPADWLDSLDWPLAVGEHERVAVRAATPTDLRRFAERERRAAANDFASRNAACEGALAVVERLEGAGVETVGELVGQTGAAA